MSDEKVCTKCKRSLPATLDFFHRNNKCKNNLDSRCKQCRNKKNMNWRKDNKEYIEKYREENKTHIKMMRKKDVERRSRIIGEDVVSLHNWIRRRKRKFEFCMICNEKKSRLQLASIDHKYTRNPEDYIWLCQSCHYLFDKCRGEMIES